jgi:hypothetical protein
MGWTKRASSWGGLAALGLSVFLAACGGGSTQVPKEPFKPTRVLSFGDELSYLEDDKGDGNGRKYSVNYLADPTSTPPTVVRDCSVYRIWNQQVAQSYGLAFPECLKDIPVPTPPATPAPATGIIYARPGAKLAEVQSQINTHLTAYSGFTRSELVTFMAGSNDVLALYARFDGSNLEALKAEAEQIGRAMAGQVNRIADAGGRVVVSTIPDLSLSPFAIAEDVAHPGTNRIGVIRELVDRFNAKLRVNIYNDGTRIGLVLIDQYMIQVAAFPGGYGLTNIKEAICLPTAPLPECYRNTLKVDENGLTADPLAWMWADNLRVSVPLHIQLANEAYARSQINPF